MTNNGYRIIYTHTDEAPALATYSFYPIIKTFAEACGVKVETRDISLAGRSSSNFPEKLAPAQRIPDDLAELGELATKPEANIIKLPNISASVPQLKAAIAELQAQGYTLPDYPEEPANDEEKATHALRQGDGQRREPGAARRQLRPPRAPKAVKEYARKNPHSMGKWSPRLEDHVAHMDGGRLLGQRKSRCRFAKPARVRIEFIGTGRHGHRAQGADTGQGRRDHRRHHHEHAAS